MSARIQTPHILRSRLTRPVLWRSGDEEVKSGATLTSRG